MAPESKVERDSGANFIQFSGPQAAELSRLIKYFLEKSLYRIEYLAKLETTTLKVYDK